MKNSLAQNRKTVRLERALHQKPVGIIKSPNTELQSCWGDRKGMGEYLKKWFLNIRKAQKISHWIRRNSHLHTSESDCQNSETKRGSGKQRGAINHVQRIRRRLIGSFLSEIVGVRKHQKDIFKLPKEKYLSTRCFVLFLIWQNYPS